MDRLKLDGDLLIGKYVNPEIDDPWNVIHWVTNKNNDVWYKPKDLKPIISFSLNLPPSLTMSTFFKCDWHWSVWITCMRVVPMIVPAEDSLDCQSLRIRHMHRYIAFKVFCNICNCQWWYVQVEMNVEHWMWKITWEKISTNSPSSQEWYYPNKLTKFVEIYT